MFNFLSYSRVCKVIGGKRQLQSHLLHTFNAFLKCLLNQTKVKALPLPLQHKIIEKMTIGSPAPEQTHRMLGSNKAASRSASPRSSKAEFPIKLYAMLELADNIPEFAKAVTWLPHGRAFRVLDQDTFMTDVVPVFFNQTKIRSFNRQLHMWGFHR